MKLSIVFCNVSIFCSGVSTGMPGLFGKAVFIILAAIFGGFAALFFVLNSKK